MTIYGHGSHFGLRTTTILGESFVPLPQVGSTWNLSNIGPEASEEKSFEIINIFYQHQMHTEVNLTSPKKGQTSMYQHHFNNFGRPPVSDDLCLDSAWRHPLSWRRRFLRVFYHIWAWRPSWSIDSNHFSILSFPCPREGPNEIWATLAQRLQRRSFVILNIFPIQMHREATLTSP